MTLLASHNFDEASGDILDVSGNGHSFPLGLASRVAGESGHGSALASSAVIAGPAVFGQTAQRTLMMRMTLPASAPTACWVYEWHLSSGDTGTWGLLWLPGAGGIGFRGRNPSGSTAFAVAAAPTDGLPHHYAGTFDGTTVRFYLDGVLVGSAALSGGITTAADSMRMLDPVGGGPSGVDDVRVYDVALDAATIAALAPVPVSAGSPSEDHTGSLARTGAGSLTLAGSASFSGVLAAAGVGLTTASASPATSGTRAADGSGALTAAGCPAPAQTLSSAGTGAFVTDAAPDLATAVDRSGSGVLDASGTPAFSGVLALSGSGALSPAPYVEPSFVDLSLTAAMAGTRWAAAVTDGRWSATIEPDPWTGAVES